MSLGKGRRYSTLSLEMIHAFQKNLCPVLSDLVKTIFRVATNHLTTPQLLDELSHILRYKCSQWMTCRASYVLNTFLTIFLRKVSHANSCVSLSVMIFLGQTTFQSWPPNSVANWASSIIQSLSLAHLNSYPPTRRSSSA